MRRTGWLFAFVCFFFASLQSALATVRVHIDISTQTMTVTSDRGGSYSWPVSTARAGYVTPRGTFRPQRMMAVAFSAKYHNSPMPHSIFFTGGYAIHGSYATGSLGRPASHGCVRLAPGNAAVLFQLVRAEGAVISITGSSGYAVASHHHGKGSRYAMHHHHGSGGVHVASHHHHHHAGSYMAYAPQHHAPSVKVWQQHPTDF